MPAKPTPLAAVRHRLHTRRGRKLLTNALLMVPVMILGLVIGNRLHHALTGSRFMRLLALLFHGNKISLLMSAMKGLIP